MAEYINREVVLSKCNDIWNNADETTQTGVDTINTIDKITDFIESLPTTDVPLVVDTENMAIVPNEFICKKCGVYMKDYIQVVIDEDNDGYIDEQHYEYEPKFCPECGAKVESCIKTPKRDKPLYTMDEICKMNGVEFKGGVQK
jgi:hypothetical protein